MFRLCQLYLREPLWKEVASPWHIPEAIQNGIRPVIPVSCPLKDVVQTCWYEVNDLTITKGN